MSDKNMSDFIEMYLKELLASVNQVEIRRSDIATRFDVVPSQINYVIKTRFTLQKGYLVESKRGGGGYIRIVKVAVGPDSQYIETMLHELPKTMNVKQADDILECLTREAVLTEHEECLIQTVLSKETLDVLASRADQEYLRARLLKQLLNRLRFESERD